MKEVKYVLEVLICGLVFYVLYSAFGLVLGIFLTILIISVILLLWICLCWVISTIFGIGILSVGTIVDGVSEKVDECEQDDKQDETLTNTEPSTDGKYGCMMGLLFAMCIVGSGLCTLYLWEMSYLIGMPLLIILLIISWIKYRKMKKMNWTNDVKLGIPDFFLRNTAFYRNMEVFYAI